ncbi:hypothetical protein HK097_011367 [Rhizophlyctis rosea]|uniref:Uncharacterized protein n=1 Tax=Rhizophlyctis rosea TaxID=64517 RepID=A0AAD5SHP4_9FUNG|nr:hypothetical protein HK097_011367 [Rhizophlyctis rosea]
MYGNRRTGREAPQERNGNGAGSERASPTPDNSDADGGKQKADPGLRKGMMTKKMKADGPGSSPKIKKNKAALSSPFVQPVQTPLEGLHSSSVAPRPQMAGKSVPEQVAGKRRPGTGKSVPRHIQPIQDEDIDVDGEGSDDADADGSDDEGMIVD